MQTEIPEDVMMHAERLYDDGGYKTVPIIIAEAIMAERSRCYEIAMDLGNYSELSVAKRIKGESYSFDKASFASPKQEA